MIVETNLPATPAGLQQAEAELQLSLPDYLKAFYRRHDGFQVYGVNGRDKVHHLKYLMLGVATEHIRIEQLTDPLDRKEYSDLYQNKYAGKAPLVFTTQEFHEWLYELDDCDNSRLDALGFPNRHICIAIDWLKNESYWVKAGSEEALVYRAPSPRFSLLEDIAQSYLQQRYSFNKFLQRLSFVGL